MLRGKKKLNKSIFVSSTFRDMQAERDAMRDYVLPKVNEFASRYGRTIELIDLRWGVDTAAVSEEEQNNKVLRTCLDEIERSRPFFIGLIGECYGWVPPEADMAEVLEASSFSIDNLNKSVTALEIEYGALRAKKPPVCLFYFRENPDYGILPEPLLRIYRDGEAGLKRLAALKTDIRARFGPDAKSYTAQVSEDGLSVSKEWADMVAGDIITKLRAEWGEAAKDPPDWRQREQDIQNAFRESRTEFFMGRSAAVAEMRDFCLEDDKGKPQMLMLKGEAGSGKSGLLCKVMEEIENDCLLLPFCFGLSPRSSDAENMLRYFIFLLSERLGVEDDSDKIRRFDLLKSRFYGLAHTACETMWVVAVVDGLDQAGGREARQMLWLSEAMPENFRVLCSIIDGPEEDELTRKGGIIRVVLPMGQDDIIGIIRGMSARYHKAIGDRTIGAIMEKRSSTGVQAAQNPLYLSLVVRDLTLMDRHEHAVIDGYMAEGLSQPDALAKYMGERINEMPGDAEGAYLYILDRFERLIGKDFVRLVCGLIAVSETGLRESELKGAFSKAGADFNPADFSWLRHIMGGQFRQGDLQQWDFSHQSLRRALWRDREAELIRLNGYIVEHFIETCYKPYHRYAVHHSFFKCYAIHHLWLADRPDIAAEVLSEADTGHDIYMEALVNVHNKTDEDRDDFLSAVLRAGEKLHARHGLPKVIKLVVSAIAERSSDKYAVSLLETALTLLERIELQNSFMLEYTADCCLILAPKLERQGMKDAANAVYDKALRIAMQSDYNLTVTAMAHKIRLFEECGDFARAEAFLLWMLVRVILNNHKKNKQTPEKKVQLVHAFARAAQFYSCSGMAEKAEPYFYLANYFLDIDYIREARPTDQSELWTWLADYMETLKQKLSVEIYLYKGVAAGEHFYQRDGSAEALRRLSNAYYELGRRAGNRDYVERALDARRLAYKKAPDSHDLAVIDDMTGTLASLRGGREKPGIQDTYGVEKMLDLNPILISRNVYKKAYENGGDTGQLRQFCYALRDAARFLCVGGGRPEGYIAYRKAVAAFAELAEHSDEPGDHELLSSICEESGYMPVREADGKLVRYDDRRWNLFDYNVTKDDGKGRYIRVETPATLYRRVLDIFYGLDGLTPEDERSCADIYKMLYDYVDLYYDGNLLLSGGILVKSIERDADMLEANAMCESIPPLERRKSVQTLSGIAIKTIGFNIELSNNLLLRSGRAWKILCEALAGDEDHHKIAMELYAEMYERAEGMYRRKKEEQRAEAMRRALSGIG